MYYNREETVRQLLLEAPPWNGHSTTQQSAWPKCIATVNQHCCATSRGEKGCVNNNWGAEVVTERRRWGWLMRTSVLYLIDWEKEIWPKLVASSFSDMPILMSLSPLAKLANQASTASVSLGPEPAIQQSSSAPYPTHRTRYQYPWPKQTLPMHPTCRLTRERPSARVNAVNWHYWAKQRHPWCCMDLFLDQGAAYMKLTGLAMKHLNNPIDSPLWGMINVCPLLLVVTSFIQWKWSLCSLHILVWLCQSLSIPEAPWRLVRAKPFTSHKSFTMVWYGNPRINVLVRKTGMLISFSKWHAWSDA